MNKVCTTVLLVSVVVAGLMCADCGRSKEPPPPAPTSPTPVPAPPVAQRVSVVGVTVGRALDGNKRVAAAVDTFAPSDTIYVSIDTQGSASAAALTARWTYQDGQLIREEAQTIAPKGPATSEFHVSKPDGWPSGSYTVEILLDGAPAGRASFRVG